MARHGTLPEFMYQRQCEISEKPVSIAFDKQGNTADASRENDLNEDEEDDFDESSDEEVVEICGKIPRYFKERLKARRRFSWSKNSLRD